MSGRQWVERRSQVPAPTVSAFAFITGVVLMVGFALAAITVIVVLRPAGTDNVLLVTTIIGLVSTSTISILTYLKMHETQQAVNGHLAEMVASARLAARAQGITEGRDQARSDEEPKVLTSIAEIQRVIRDHTAWERTQLAALAGSTTLPSDPDGPGA